MNQTLQSDNRRSWKAKINGFGLYKAVLLLCMTIAMAATSIQAQDCEPHWSEQYAAPYLSGIPTDITIFDDGSGSGPRPYICGLFLDGAGIALNNITQLNENNSWSPLGDGLNDYVFALTTFDDGKGVSESLYAVGNFTSAGEISANNIAKWDGQVWSALGDGLDAGGRSVVVFDDGNGAALYVGGFFENAGGMSANYIAKWDGQKWSPLGEGTDGSVLALAVFDDGSGPVLYAGGNFENAGGIIANNIAKWDGTNWASLGEGTNSKVKTFAVFDDGSGPALYAGGNFTLAGGNSANHIAKWDGASWIPVGTGTDGIIMDLTVVDFCNGPALFAAGWFGEAGGVACSRIAKWDGELWSPLGSGLSLLQGSFIDVALTSFDDGSADGAVLLVAGRFDYAGEISAQNFARWDDNEWSTAGGIFPSKFYGRTMTVVEEGSNVGPGLYCGGYSDYVLGTPVNNIIRFEDGEWETLGEGTNSSVQALKHFDDGFGLALFVGGGFTEAGGMPANRVAKWDGNSWSALGDGLDEPVMSMCVFDDGAGDGPLLYAGGYFKHSGDTSMYCIAKWDGENWISLAQYLSPYSDSVRTMIVFDDGTGYGDALYVGGNFYRTNDTDAFKNVARWDGAEWSEMDNGSFTTVYAFAVYDDGTGPALYASGKFGLIDALAVYGVGRWDGKEWSIVPGGDMPNGTIRTFQVFNDGLSDRPALYIGGVFDMVGSIEANRIARWDGKNWSALGSGLEISTQINAAALAMAVFDDGEPQGESLFVTGGFLLAGGNSSNSFAQWIPCINPIPGDLDGDGLVSTADLLILLGNWGPCNECPADLDDDGFVGTSDLLILLSNWS